MFRSFLFRFLSAFVHEEFFLTSPSLFGSLCRKIDGRSARQPLRRSSRSPKVFGLLESAMNSRTHDASVFWARGSFLDRIDAVCFFAESCKPNAGLLWCASATYIHARVQQECGLLAGENAHAVHEELMPWKFRCSLHMVQNCSERAPRETGSCDKKAEPAAPFQNPHRLLVLCPREFFLSVFSAKNSFCVDLAKRHIPEGVSTLCCNSEKHDGDVRSFVRASSSKLSRLVCILLAASVPFYLTLFFQAPFVKSPPSAPPFPPHMPYFQSFSPVPDFQTTYGVLINVVSLTF